MLKVAFIINSARKLTREVQEILNECQNSPALDVHRFDTRKQKDAIDLAFDCAQNEFDYVVAVGGDGTVNEVVNGLLKSEKSTPILAVLPNGTGNDFIRGTTLKRNLADFIQSLIEKKTIPIDVAKLQADNKNYYFINIADVGFGGKVVQILDKQRRFIGGKASYALAILRTFIGYRKPILEITTDDFHFIGPVLMVAICNGSIFGDGLTINPYAKLDDGKLNITLLGKVTLFDYVRNLTNLKKGQPIIHPEAKYLEAKNVRIKVVKGNAVTEMDGEFLNTGNITIENVPMQINLLSY